jgi:hypothetical protein
VSRLFRKRGILNNSQPYIRLHGLFRGRIFSCHHYYYHHYRYRYRYRYRYYYYYYYYYYYMYIRD